MYKNISEICVSTKQMPSYMWVVNCVTSVFFATGLGYLKHINHTLRFL